MPSVIQRSFAGGEISPAVHGRADQTKYATGLRTCRNFMVMRHGGVTNRPGTVFVCEVKDSSSATRLLKFVFNASQTYILEFGDQYMRVIQEGAQLESGGSPYEIVTPYAAADLAGLQFVQSADVVTIVHPSYAPRELARTGHTSWTLSTITFAPSIDAPTGVANTGVIGSGTSWVVTAAKAETYEESLPSAVTESSSVPASGSSVIVTWDPVPGAEEYYVYRSENGVFGYIGTSTGVGFVDTGMLPDLSDTPPIARNPFNAAGDYPSTVTYFQQRLGLANTDNEPEKVWFSRSGNFHNFSIRRPLQDDDAVTFTMAGRQVNEVRHLFEIGRLIALTAGGEWTIDGDSDGVLRPTAINAVQHGYRGSAEIAPIIVGSNALYLQARGAMVRDLRYTLETDGYTGNDLTIFSSHLFDGYQIVAWDFQQIPHSIVWAVRNDGILLGLTYLQEHAVWGWHRHDTAGGYVEDVCVVPEGDEDAVYLIVRRTIGGDTKRYIERMASRRVTDIRTDAFFVDCGLTYDGRNTDSGHSMTLTGGTDWTYTEDLTLTSSASYFSAADVGNAIVFGYGEAGDSTLTLTIIGYTSATVVTVQANKNVPAGFQGTATSDWAKAVDSLAGLSHLEGETVSILADGNVEAQEIVTGGAITLQRPYSVVHVGLPIEADFETLELENPQGETLLDKKKLINKVSLLVESSRGIFVGPDADHLQEFKQRSSEDYGEPTALTTGTAEILMQATWTKNGRIFVRQSDPLPLTILAAIPAGTVS